MAKRTVCKAEVNPDELANPSRVNVFLEGGIVQNIEVPEGVEVHVYDYDVEGLEQDRIEKDGLGDDCAITIWTVENQAKGC